MLPMLLRKRSVTLIELLIGCALLAVLISLVFGIWGELNKGHKKIDDERDLLWEKVKLEASLDQLLLKIVPLKNEEGVGFYTDSEGGLVFISQVGASVDPLFVDQVLCKLHCVEGDFVVDQWPDPERLGVFPKEMRRLILLEGVSETVWEFFVPPNRNIVIETPQIGIGKETEEQRAPTGWSSSWKPGYKKIPVLLKLTLQKGKTLYRYETYLPATSYPLELPE